MALAAGAMSILFQIGMTSEITQIIAVAVLVTFIIAFAISAGPLVWVLCPEILPAAGRSFGVSVSTLVIWASSMTVTGTFLTLIDLLGQSTTFAMYALFNVVFLCVTIFFIPETRNRSLEQLERNLFKGLPLRHLGNLGELEHNAAPMTKTQ